MRIHFHKYFNKSYKKCSQKTKDRFQKRLKIFLDNPHHSLLASHALIGEWQGFRSINITSDYRALYQYLDDDAVEFFIIDTHSNLYG